jgi:hypothetical protein
MVTKKKKSEEVRRKLREHPRASVGILEHQQQVADRIVAEYQRHREVSAAAWKRFDVATREALMRYRGSGYRDINGALRPPPSEKKSKKTNTPVNTDWSSLTNWLTPPRHWMMTVDPIGQLAKNAEWECALYDTPVGSVERLAVRYARAVGEAIKALDALFSGPAPVTEGVRGVTVFRGASGDEATELLAAAVGTEVPVPAFLSTSLSPSTARDFMHYTYDSGPEPKKNTVMVVLRVPPGVPFFFFDGATNGVNDTLMEMEILLPRGAALRVTEAAKRRTDVSYLARTALDKQKGLGGKEDGTMLVLEAEFVWTPGSKEQKEQKEQNTGTLESRPIVLYPTMVAAGRDRACKRKSRKSG